MSRDSEDVNDFLARVREMGDRHDSEDAERARKLEEDIMQSRKERQARRAERARSISPTKDSPLSTPKLATPTVPATTMLTSSKIDIPATKTINLSHAADFEARDDHRADALEKLTGEPSPTKSQFPPSASSEARDTPAVSAIKANEGGLSRTPTLSWQQRPGSGLRGPRPLSMVETRRTPEPRPASRSEDETPSRDQIAASLGQKDPMWFRQTADRGVGSAAYRKSPEADANSFSRMQLPGMTGLDPEKRSVTPLSDRASPIPQKEDLPSHKATTPEPISRKSPSLPHPGSDGPGLERQRSISPDRGDRPSSPSKGIGSFVQSAMLKRENSLSKRWSVQTGTGLQRGNSILVGRGLSSPERPQSPAMSDKSSPRGSRSGSPIRHVMNADELDTKPQPVLSSKPIATRDDASPPSSPTKTADQRRWSPTKSSWLESALNKSVEVPKAKPVPSEQPNWMVDRASAQGSPPKKSSFAEVNTGGLMRAPAMGTGVKPSNLWGPSLSRSSTPVEKPTPKPKPIGDFKQPLDVPEAGKRPDEAPQTVKSEEFTKGTPPASVRPDLKPKPSTPPKSEALNFRAGLRSRPPVEPKPAEEPEFKNALGKLRAARTQNYVAPDILKENITRGKSALNVTGGPKKTERKDEFKESILQKKTSMKAKAEEEQRRPGVFIAPKKEAAAPPEAITRSNTIRSKQKPQPPASQGSTDDLDKPKNVSSKLADRFNPNLANLLARGPPAAKSPPLEESSAPSIARAVETRPAADAELTHMTKGRARGPKRRLPTKTAAAKSEPEPQPKLEQVKPVEPRPSSAQKPATQSPEVKSKPYTPNKPKIETLQRSPPPISPKPSFNSLQLSKTETNSSPAEEPTRLTEQRHILTSPIEKNDVPVISVKSAAAVWTQKEPDNRRPKSPIKLPTRADEEKAEEAAGLRSPPATKKLASPQPSPKPPVLKEKPSFTPKESIPVLERPATPEIKPSAVAIEAPESPVPRTSEAYRLFSEHFKGIFPLNKATRVDFDVQDILSRTPSSQARRPRTLKKQVWQLTKDGKILEIPPEKEHIFYENSMYLLSHVYDRVYGDTGNTKNTYVYFWVGNAVSSAAADDALLFARHFSKEAGGAFDRVSQGSEPTLFLQALGGIMVTRRLENSRTFLLCGRHHLGHVVFDEVDCTVMSLCSGFPYLLVTESGTFLWKGAGATTDELACARLIAMDIGGSPDIIEVEEGSEPAKFTDALGGKTMSSASHWKLRQKTSDYDTRLFTIGDNGVDEIIAFRQQDLVDARHGVVVIDGWFEVYVVLMPSSVRKYNAFLTSLSFVQEYTILASSMQDRPFVPVVTVVILSSGGVAPRDLKRLFRTWSEFGGTKSGLKVIGLSAALAAVSKV